MSVARDLERLDRRQTPVVINNFNRLASLKTLVDRLRSCGLHDLHVLDNQSTYAPLLDYYRVIPARVIRLERNVGYLALWETAYSLSLGDLPFIYTDADVYPDDECPDDFIDRLFEALQTHSQLDKVGLGLRIDDLPATSPLTPRIVAHEAGFWQRRLSAGLYQAAVDTTFALYRPGRCGGHWLNAARTSPPYLARHVPWYLDPSDLGEEEIHYRSQVKTLTHWSSAED